MRILRIFLVRGALGLQHGGDHESLSLGHFSSLTTRNLSLLWSSLVY